MKTKVFVIHINYTKLRRLLLIDYLCFAKSIHDVLIQQVIDIIVFAFLGLKHIQAIAHRSYPPSFQQELSLTAGLKVSHTL